MTQNSAYLTALATRIMERELAGRVLAAEVAGGIELAFHRLHGLVAALVGQAGFEAVISRAVILTLPICPHFEGIQIRYGTPLSMPGLVATVEREGATPVGTCAAALLQNILGLLASFIGEPLTVRIVHRGWTGVVSEVGPAPGRT